MRRGSVDDDVDVFIVASDAQHDLTAGARTTGSAGAMAPRCTDRREWVEECCERWLDDREDADDARLSDARGRSDDELSSS